MKYLLMLTSLSLLLWQCEIDRTISSLNTDEQEALLSFQSLPDANQVYTTPDNEPGEKLWICLTVTSKESGKPLSNQSMYLYHTNAEGEYQPSDVSDESTARLNGSAKTDELGRICADDIAR